MFEKHRSQIRLKLNLMDVIIIHEVELKDDATAVILRGSPFFGTVPPTKMFKTQDEMPAFFLYCASAVLIERIKNKTEYLPIFGTVPPIFSPKVLQKK